VAGAKRHAIKIWTSNPGGDSVTAFRASDGKIQSISAIGKTPFGLAFDGAIFGLLAPMATVSEAFERARATSCTGSMSEVRRSASSPIAQACGWLTLPTIP